MSALVAHVDHIKINNQSITTESEITGSNETIYTSSQTHYGILEQNDKENLSNRENTNDMDSQSKPPSLLERSQSQSPIPDNNSTHQSALKTISRTSSPDSIKSSLQLSNIKTTNRSRISKSKSPVSYTQSTNSVSQKSRSSKSRSPTNSSLHSRSSRSKSPASNTQNTNSMSQRSRTSKSKSPISFTQSTHSISQRSKTSRSRSPRNSSPYSRNRSRTSESKSPVSLTHSTHSMSQRSRTSRSRSPRNISLYLRTSRSKSPVSKTQSTNSISQRSRTSGSRSPIATNTSSFSHNSNTSPESIKSQNISERLKSPNVNFQRILSQDKRSGKSKSPTFTSIRNTSISPDSKCQSISQKSIDSAKSIENEISKKKKNLIDSDSDHEGNPSMDDDKSNDVINVQANLNLSSKKKIKNLIDSDSDDEIALLQKKDELHSLQLEKQNTKKKISNIIDSDSDVEEIVHNVSNKENSTNSEQEHKKKNNKKHMKKKKKYDFMDTDSDDSHQEEKRIKKTSKKKNKDSKTKLTPKLYDFMDTESENELGSASDQSSCSKKNYKSILDSDSENAGSETEGNTTKSKRSNKPERKKGTARAAKESAMREIHSETQRLMRESEISLPYHRPKQRSLQEFLNRKKMLQLPHNLSRADKVKMLPELISKAVQEKEKEAEEFYKSSDSEEEAKIEKAFTGIPENKTGDFPLDRMDSLGPNVLRTRENLAIAETQKLIRDEIEDNDNKKDILQKRSLELGVPKKLFSEGDNEDEVDDAPASQKVFNEDENLRSHGIELLRKRNEFKHGLPNFVEPFKSSVANMEEEKSKFDKNEWLFDRMDSLGPNVLRTRDNLEIIETQKLPKEVLQKRADNSTVTKKLFVNDEEIPDNINSTIEDLNESMLQNENRDESNKITNNDTIMDISIQEMLEVKDEDMEVDLIVTTANNQDAVKTIKAHTLENANGLCREEMDESSQNITLNISDQEINNVDSRKINENDTETILKADENLERFEKTAMDEQKSAQTNKPRILEDRIVNVDIRGLNCSRICKTNNSAEVNNLNEDPEKDIDSDHFIEGNIIDANVLREDFGFPLSDSDDEDHKKKIGFKDGLISIAKNKNPVIKGFPGMIIDLNDTGKLKDGAKQLLDRFHRHNVVKKPVERKVAEVPVVYPEATEDGVKIIEEIIPFKITPNKPGTEGKPGEKMFNLKQDLKKRIAMARDAEWKQKEEEMKLDEDEDVVEDKFYENLPNEEDELEDEEIEYSTESEPEEEDDIPMEDKENPKNEFVDEEAEESDIEEDEDDIHLVDEGDSTENEEDETDTTSNVNEENVSDNENSNTSTQPRKLKRIIKAFDDDDDDEVSNYSIQSAANEDMFANTSDSNAHIAEEITNRTCKTPLPKSTNTFSNLVSPVTQLTALNTLGDSCSKSSASKNQRIDSNKSEPQSLEKPAQSFEKSDKFTNLQKKLFEDTADQVNDDLLMEICSGKFVETQNLQNDSSNPEDDIELNRHKAEKNVTDSQLLELCSGSFNTQINDLEKNTANNDTIQNLELSLDENSQIPNDPQISDASLKSPCDTVIINTGSSLEKALENEFDPAISFCKKLDIKTTISDLKSHLALSKLSSPELVSDQIIESPVSIQNQVEEKEKLSVFSKQATKGKIEESKHKWKGLVIESSSDEEGGEKVKKTKKKKKKMKKPKALELSDDEDNANQYSDASDYDEEDVEDDEVLVDYDSDENEIIVPKKDIKTFAKSKFVEQEAELSGEDDWEGSEDEDEKDLDNYEEEEGDNEHIDDKQVKDQLERLHMKQIMDEDQREIKNLQDMLFEDGDLYSEGAGRERRFKWKNADTDMNIEVPNPEDAVEAIEEDIDPAMEIELRKMRYEQQKFIEEKEKDFISVLEENFSETPEFDLGLKIVSSNSVNKPVIEERQQTVAAKNTTNITKINIQSSIKSTKSLINSSVSGLKGSFLARGESTLIKIAQNLSEATNVKASSFRKKNFVFQHLSPLMPKDDDESEESLNKADGDTNESENRGNQKRKRPDNAGNTPTTSKKMKVNNYLMGKKLF